MFPAQSAMPPRINTAPKILPPQITSISLPFRKDYDATNTRHGLAQE